MDDKPPLWVEFLVPAAITAFGIAYYVTTVDLSRQAVFFPRTMMVIMAVLTVVLLAREIASRRRTSTQPPAAAEGRTVGAFLADYRNPALIVGSAALYIVAIRYAGYFPATIVFLTASLLVFRVPALRAIAIGVLFPAALYAVFVLGFSVRVS